jgi:hypothetical protein
MRAVVRDGYFPRSQAPEEQTLEVVRRFDLAQAIDPYSRCLRCNGVLTAVEKSAVHQQLESLTREHYEVFRRCESCGNVYWSGSHFSKLEALVARLRVGSEATS